MTDKPKTAADRIADAIEDIAADVNNGEHLLALGDIADYLEKYLPRIATALENIVEAIDEQGE